MPRTNENRHRWKKSLGPRVVEVLEKTAEVLEVSWKVDNEYPNSYPTNTDHTLSETKAKLKSKAPVVHSSKELRKSRALAKSLYDLVDDEVVRTLYEQQYDSYSRTVKQASKGFGRRFGAWRKIVKCLTPAYPIKFGVNDLMPKTRVHLLHRKLLEIAKSLEPDLSKEGLVEFLDDICPCGKKHEAEAIWKLGRRIKKSLESERCIT